MSLIDDLEASGELIPSQEIHELSMCSHEYVQQAIWWVRLARALDSLAEELVIANLHDLGRELAKRAPHLSDQALGLESMGDEALGAVDAARMHVTAFAGESKHAQQVRETVKWVGKRIQLINYLVEDLLWAGSCGTTAAKAQPRLRLVAAEPATS